VETLFTVAWNKHVRRLLSGAFIFACTLALAGEPSLLTSISGLWQSQSSMYGFRLKKMVLRINAASAEKQQCSPRAAVSFLQTQLNGKTFGALTQLP
jgi:hypothetical protein